MIHDIAHLEDGDYAATIRVFADLVKGYTPDGEKIWANDPQMRDGLIRVTLGDGTLLTTDWEPLIPGIWNDVLVVFTREGGGPSEIKIEFMCPFPLPENGLFMDDWELEMLTNEPATCECGAISDTITTVLWIPQYTAMTGDETQRALNYAIDGFRLPDGSLTSGGHMLCPSHVDALRIHTSGLPGSVLAVVYPHKIGTGVTPQWIIDNCPCAYEDGRQVVFLDEEKSGFEFTHLPVK